MRPLTNYWFLALLLLVLRVFTDNHYFTLSLDYLALFADRLNGSSYFHFIILLSFTSPGNSTSCKVVW